MVSAGIPIKGPIRGVERRRHLRLNLMGLAGITIQGGESLEAYMGCIGRGGAGCYTMVKPESDQLAVLDLKGIDPQWKDLDMKFAARVRWVQPTGKLYLVGLRFEKMADERYGLLLRHLKLMKDLQL